MEITTAAIVTIRPASHPMVRPALTQRRVRLTTAILVPLVADIRSRTMVIAATRTIVPTDAN